MSSYNEFELLPPAKVIDQVKKEAEEEEEILRDIKNLKNKDML